MDLVKVSSALRELGEPAYRIEQVRRAVFREAASYEEMTVLSPELRRALCERAPLLSVAPARLEVSRDGRARKALLRLSDGKVVETVLLRPSPSRWTTCISCQAGCAFACGFCATGLMGFSRDLTREEITDQVLFWRLTLRREALVGRLDNVVYMGMGEPFACYETVAESLKDLMDQKSFAIGARRISVSTVGLAPQIERFGRDFPQVNLAVSLHAADDKLRTRLVPANKAYPLERLAKALRAYLSSTSRKVFLEYVLLSGANDSPQDAERLAAFAKSVGPLELLHVNLILFNETDTPYKAATEAGAREFQRRLRSAGIHSTVRQNLGRDIRGACGQLTAAGRTPS